jgi:signal transduction histidine kinase/ActR/RegA family two-component response regulator
VIPPTTNNPPGKLVKPYLLTIIALGGAVYFLAAYRLDSRIVDLKLAVLVLLTLCISSRITIKIPQFGSWISVSDTFIFLTLLLYGADAAILMSATEALLTSFRSEYCRKPTTIVFNWACAAMAICITSYTFIYFFGDPVDLNASALSTRFITAVGLMALVQYAANSGIVSVLGALKANGKIWQTWKKYFLSTSISIFGGALAAAMIAKLMGEFGFYALIVTLPVIAIVFFTYRTYLKNIEASANQAEQAERHVEELSHYISEQERIREQFSQMEKLSALGELASGVAHDFNNTLAGILGRAQLILRTNDPEKIQRGLNIIIKTAEDGAKTVKRIQDFARQRRDHDFEPVSIDQILFDVSEITRPRWKDRAEASNVQISLDLQNHSKSKVMGDESELREVLVNMVFNSVDAMPNGGNLTLAAEDVDGSVVISVGDTGSGMPPEVKSRIFDPFFTTKGKAGMGLGLAVSFGIIRRHEGSVEVESEVGSGTKFKIILPKAEVCEEPHFVAADVTSNTSLEPSTASASRPFEGPQPKILVVDDEEPVRELLRDLLEAEGFRVYLAPGGREALSIFAAQKLDGIFTDVGMPGMSGWELAHAIRESDESIPIAVITGWGEAVGSDEQKQARVNWVIAKPFRAERISELAQEICKKRKIGVNKTTLAEVAA